MNELVKVTTSENGEQLVSGRELYKYLDVKDNYSDWFKRMAMYGFVENVDFISLTEKSDKPQGGRPSTDHAMKLDMAKEVSMIQRTDKGKEARLYFIEIEKQHKLDTSNLSPELQMFNGLFQSLAKQELATKQLETKVDSISEIVALNTIDWRKESRVLINKMAKADGGFGAYREVQKAIYQELEKRAGANLKQRLTNKRRRMADEGVCVSKRNTLNNIDVIADDKKLIEIYVAIVKEFALKYGIWEEDDSYKAIERRG